jgi:hypothetical protein
LINKRFASSILDVKSQCGTHCNSDHYLIKIKYRASINLKTQVKHKKQPKIDIQKLKNEDTLNKYQEEIKKLTNNVFKDTAGTEEHWTYLKRKYWKQPTMYLD